MRYVIGCLSVLWMSATHAFPCFVTLMKDVCWANHEISVEIKDAVHDQVETTVVVPKDKFWARAKFDCDAKEELQFVAQFSPAIWKGEESKTYGARRDWFLPATVKDKATAWNIPICFPKDFANVPLPLGDLTKCGCDSTNIPDIPPQ